MVHVDFFDERPARMGSPSLPLRETPALRSSIRKTIKCKSQNYWNT